MDNKDFLENINILLEQHGWTGADLCRVADISDNTLSRWATLKSEPSYSALIKISRAFGMSITELLAFTPKDKLTAAHYDLVNMFDKLEKTQQNALINYLKELTK